MTDPNTLITPTPTQPPDEKSKAIVKGIAHGMSFMACVGATLALLGCAASTGLILPKFTKIFDDFGTKLPALSIWIIAASKYYIAPIVLLLLAGALVAKEYFLPNPWAKLAISLGALVVSTVITVVVILGLFLPLVELIETTH